MSSDASERRLGFTVCTVYSCDVCGSETKDKEQIVQHLAEHDQKTESVSHGVPLDPSLPNQQDSVTSSSTVLLSTQRRQKLATASAELSSGQVVSQTPDSKPLICQECGRMYKYLRCFSRHVEREHKTSNNANTLGTVYGQLLQHKAVASALRPAYGSLSSLDCHVTPGNNRDSSTDNANPLSDTNHIELEESMDTVDDGLTTVSDDKQSDDVPKLDMFPYYCAECPKRFQTAHSFRLHTVDQHTGWSYVCQYCGRLFVVGDALYSHTLRVHNEILDDDGKAPRALMFNPHSCEICNHRYRSLKELHKHMELSHGVSMSVFDCSLCSGRYMTKKGLSNHTTRVHSGDHPYLCELCGNRFATIQERNVHAEEHAPDLCTLCGVRLRRRTYNGTDVGVTTCTVCHLEQMSSTDSGQVAKEPATTKTVTQRCSRMPSLPLKYSCGACGIRFAWRSNLRRHERQHTANRLRTRTTDPNTQPFQCDYCGRVFTWAGGLQKHILRHIEPGTSQPRKISCKVCGQQFSSKKSLSSHLRDAHPPSSGCHNPIITSSGDADRSNSVGACSTSTAPNAVNSVLICDYCGDKCESPESLRQHHCQQGEDVTKPNAEETAAKNDKVLVPCPECGAVFFWGSNVRRHIREQHQGTTSSQVNCTPDERHEQCNRCGRRFSRRSYLHMHLRAHENAEKCDGSRAASVLCSVCGRKMGDARQLHVHMLRHAGIRPHQCNLCSKSFYVVTQLNSHVSVVHRGNRFVCDQCGHEANSRTALKAHCRSTHPTPDDEPSHCCSVCSRRYWSAAALRRHAEAHDVTRSSIRKAMCSICSLLFRHVYNLAHHIKTTHPEVDCATPFSCGTCGQQFDSGPAFKTHYRSKHRNR